MKHTNITENTSINVSKKKKKVWLLRKNDDEIDRHKCISLQIEKQDTA